MKLKQIKLKNFRSYRWEIVLPIDNMNIILWKNDIWKSTILEALDIFFNDWKWCVKISPDDVNLAARNEPNENCVEITCIFDGFDDEIVLETITTSIASEYLKNRDWLLEIKKKYEGSTMKSTTYIVSHHPANDDFVKELLLKKISDLQKYVKEKGIKVIGKESVSSDLRKAIRDSYWNLQLDLIEIPADREGAKELWEKIYIKLPTYVLFQSDRSNSDQDGEIQNPMNIALKSVLKEPAILNKLEEVFNEVSEKLEDIARWTLVQLHNINRALASDLKPRLPDHDKLGRDKAFPKTEITSDDIPLNKRGSWVKRIILLSFFLNEVERKKMDEGLTNIIYAFEEPETSQHPAHQEILIRAFEALSQSQGVQILLTTHSPYVYKDSIKNNRVNLIHIYEDRWRKASDIRQKLQLFPHSPTWWEINYFVYELPTFEFFDELYSRLDELGGIASMSIDDFITANSAILKDQNWLKANRDWTQKVDAAWNPIVQTTTYITCVRHKIHHANNNLNTTYNVNLEQVVQKAINDMISIVSSVS